MSGNANVARPMTVSGDERALTQAMLDAVVLEAWDDSNVFFDPMFMRIKQLEPGASSHDFRIAGDSPEDAEHHVPGQWIEGGTLVQTKVNVSLDDPLIKAIRLPYEDIDINKFDDVSRAARECVRIISEKVDRRAAIVLAKAARTAAVTNVHNGGNSVERVAATVAAAYPVSTTGANNFADDAATLARLMDEDNIPQDNRFLFITPYIKQVLTRSDRLMSRDFVMANNGDISVRHVGIIEGFKLIETLHLPSTNVTTDLTKYNGDFSVGGSVGQPAALALYNGNMMGALAGVQAGGFRNVIHQDENRDVTLIKSRLYLGLGQVEPYCAGEIYVSTS